MTASGQVRRLLEKQGNELTEGIVQELEGLHRELARLRDELTSLRGASIAAPDAPRTATVAAGDTLTPAHGFYPPEQTDDGTAFNWSGPSPQFALDVAVARGNGADLRLEGINFLDFDRQKDVKLFVDGVEVPASVVKESPGVVLTANLPPRETPGDTKLSFLLPEVLPPENPEDKRTLGLAFVHLTVTANS